jgi:hypothetical protein
MIDLPFCRPRERRRAYYFSRGSTKSGVISEKNCRRKYRPNFGLSVGLGGMLCGMPGVAHADPVDP